MRGHLAAFGTAFVTTILVEARPSRGCGNTGRHTSWERDENRQSTAGRKEDVLYPDLMALLADALALRRSFRLPGLPFEIEKFTSQQAIEGLGAPLFHPTRIVFVRDHDPRTNCDDRTVAEPMHAIPQRALPASFNAAIGRLAVGST
jgi:hypothetical protein